MRYTISLKSAHHHYTIRHDNDLDFTRWALRWAASDALKTHAELRDFLDIFRAAFNGHSGEYPKQAQSYWGTEPNKLLGGYRVTITVEPARAEGRAAA